MHGEGGTLADRRLDRQPGVVAGQDVLDDREPKPGALLGAAVVDVDTVEALGDARNVLFGYARPEIADGDRDLRIGRVAPLDRDHDTAARLAVFAGVLEQVLEYLEQLVAVAARLDRLVTESPLDDDAGLPGERRQ